MTLIENHASTIARLCKLYQVKRLYAFGSVVTNDFTKESDVDLIVEFKPISLKDYADNYFNLKFALQDEFKRSVDLLEAKAVRNPFLRTAIEKQRELIYGE